MQEAKSYFYFDECIRFYSNMAIFLIQIPIYLLSLSDETKYLSTFRLNRGCAFQPFPYETVEMVLAVRGSV